MWLRDVIRMTLLVIRQSEKIVCLRKIFVTLTNTWEFARRQQQEELKSAYWTLKLLNRVNLNCFQITHFYSLFDQSKMGIQYQSLLCGTKLNGTWIKGI